MTHQHDRAAVEVGRKRSRDRAPSPSTESISRAPALAALHPLPNLLESAAAEPVTLRRTPLVGGGDRWGGAEVPADLATVLRRRRGAGSPLPAGIRTEFAAALGTDLSTVRVHADSESDRLTRTLDATAFSAGSDLYFSRGSYQPGTSAGRRVLAHELAHVTQPSSAARMTVGRADDPAEAEADRIADTMLARPATAPAEPAAARPAAETVLPTSEGHGHRLRRVVRVTPKGKWDEVTLTGVEQLLAVLPSGVASIMRKLGEAGLEKLQAAKDPGAAVLDRFLGILRPDVMYAFPEVEDLVAFLEKGTIPKVRPSLDMSPKHYSAPTEKGQRYELAPTQPASTFYPQSPTWGGAERDEIQMDDESYSSPLLDFLTTAQDQRKERNLAAQKSLNIFMAEVVVPFRVEELVADRQYGWAAVRETREEAAERTQIYQSSSKQLATSSSGGSRNATGLEDRMRQATSKAATRVVAGGNAGKFGELTIAPGDKKTVDYTQTTAKGSGGKYVVNNNQISSSCFHSEVQALAQSGHEIPVLVTALVKKIVAVAKSRLAGPDSAVSIVLNSLVVHGASVPNTVCGNACKPALTLLLDFVDKEFVETYHAQKEELSAGRIFMRRSAEYRANMSVSSTNQFQQFGKGAHAISATSSAPAHRVVREFQPRSKDRPPAEVARKELAKEKKAASGSGSTKKGKGMDLDD